MQRPNSTGWGLVLFFFIGGIAFTIAIPEIWLGQIWIVVSVGLGIMYLVMNRRADKVEKLRTTGIPGQATVLSVGQTGVYINEMPQMKLTLRVEAKGTEPFEIDKKATVPFSALAKVTPGAVFPVYLDPEKPDDVSLDWEAITAPFVMSLQDGRTINVDNAAARQEVLTLLEANGFGTSGENDLRQNPVVRGQVLDVLRRYGYPVDPITPAAGAPVAAAAAPASAPAPAAAAASVADPVDGLEKLAEMREKGLVTQDEFEAQKKRILGEL